MRNFLRFLATYHLIILFVILESIGLILLVNNNNYQNARYSNVVKSIIGFYAEKRSNVSQYLSLREVNTRLSEENTQLRNIIERNQFERIKASPTIKVNDSINHQNYTYLEAKIVNNAVNKQYNYITIDKGSASGIEKDMAVISPSGPVGIIVSVSEHYSLAISVLNRNLKISSKIKKNGYFGSLEWPGISYKTAYLNEIPIHVMLSKGDTIITSGFSTHFPEGIPVGYITDYKVKGGNFYQIEVALSTDFKKLNYVYVIKSLHKTERETIEKGHAND